MLTKRVKSVVMVTRLGQILLNTKESGGTIRRMAEVSYGAQMEIPMKESGKTTKQMALVTLDHKMARKGTLASGKMISTMAKVLRVGLMALVSMVISHLEKRTDSVHTSGPMEHFTQATGSTTKCKGRVLTSGSTAANM